MIDFARKVLVYLFCPPYKDGTETRWGTVTNHKFDWDIGDYIVWIEGFPNPVSMGFMKYWERKRGLK